MRHEITYYKRFIELIEKWDTEIESLINIRKMNAGQFKIFVLNSFIFLIDHINWPIYYIGPQ